MKRIFLWLWSVYRIGLRRTLRGENVVKPFTPGEPTKLILKNGLWERVE